MARLHLYMPSAASKTSGETSGDWRQEMAKVRGTLARIQRVIKILTANQVRQEQVPH